jgi:ORF6N domain
MSNKPAAKAKAPMQALVGSRIQLFREQRVLLDTDLAELYGVETRVLVQAVKRNLGRFPADFMFQLNAEEFIALRSQSVISNTGRGGRRTAPYAFTEQGVAMLSSVLNSDQAISANIQIMRAFVQLRQLASTHDDLAKKLAQLEDRVDGLTSGHDSFSRNTRVQLKQLFDALRELANSTPPPEPPKRPIGFVTHQDKKLAAKK